MGKLQGAAARALMVAAGLSMAATPALAHGGWGGRHHDDGIDAGAVFAGLLIVGGVAAIASAVSQQDKDAEPQPAPDPAPPSLPREDPQDGAQESDSPDDGEAGSGWQLGTHSPALDSAVETCAAEGDRRGGTDQIFEAGPDGGGFRVRGNLASGQMFTCAVDQDGRVSRMEVSGPENQDQPADRL